MPDAPKTLLPSKNGAQIAAVLLLMVCIACGNGDNTNVPKADNSPASNAPAAKYGYQILNIFPHDSNAFTQGLILVDGKLLESTGQEGSSSLRSVELETGKVLKKVDVPPPYFAEGIAMLNGKVYQLTWQHSVGFIYDLQTLERAGQFDYQGEGWGLTTDGQSLIVSDGSSKLKFLDPASFRVTKTISVVDGAQPVNQLNELEFVKGEIYANVWHSDRVAVIDPQTGRVKAWIDLTGLMPEGELLDEEAVLNGIAYDQANDKFYVTGKLWPRLFEIKVKR
ncbi:MAG TPA: glutaminyl-peptide cyclotransferase [Pyrinomonadaceae bacterium]|nr:glutaminyl-peptide cyclotransferase [Pyrinomonadaceae bacterium]